MEGKLKAGHLGDGQCSSLGHFPFWAEKSVAFQRLVSEAWSGEVMEILARPMLKFLAMTKKDNGEGDGER